MTDIAFPIVFNDGKQVMTALDVMSQCKTQASCTVSTDVDAQSAVRRATDYIMLPGSTAAHDRRDGNLEHRC